MTRELPGRYAAQAPSVAPLNDRRATGQAATRNWLLILLYVVISSVVLGVLAFAIFRPIVVLPRIRLAPGFSFSNIVTGESVRNDELRGQLTLYSFVFADCLVDESCQHNQAQHEAMLAQAAEVNQTIAQTAEAASFNLVTILLDEELEATWVNSQEPADGWQLIHGDPLHTRYTVGQGFRLFYAADRDEPYVAPKTILVDGWGTIRAEYRNGFPEPDIFERDLLLLNEEIQNSTGINRLGYEAAHLFVCYP